MCFVAPVGSAAEAGAPFKNENCVDVKGPRISTSPLKWKNVVARENQTSDLPCMKPSRQPQRHEPLAQTQRRRERTRDADAMALVGSDSFKIQEG